MLYVLIPLSCILHPTSYVLHLTSILRPTTYVLDFTSYVIRLKSYYLCLGMLGRVHYLVTPNLLGLSSAVTINTYGATHMQYRNMCQLYI